MATFDFNISKFDSRVDGGLIDYVMVDEDGKSDAITGPLKATQKFATLFLTELGSVPEDPDQGTSFIAELRFGGVRSEFDLLSAFTQAVAEAMNYFDQRQADEDLPDDETIVDAQLTDYTLEAPNVFLFITVITAAGDSRTIQVPVDTVAIQSAED